MVMNDPHTKILLQNNLICDEMKKKIQLLKPNCCKTP